MRTPSLAVILVNWRNEDRTIPCVAGVKRWTSLKPRVIVVDNQSTSESHRALSRVVAPEELICSEVNLGYGGGNNLGIARAISRPPMYRTASAPCPSRNTGPRMATSSLSVRRRNRALTRYD